MNKINKILPIIFTSILTLLYGVILVDSIAEVYGEGWIFEATGYYIIAILNALVFMSYTILMMIFALNEKRLFQSVIGSLAVGSAAIVLLSALLYGNPYFFMCVVSFLIIGLFLYERNKTKNNNYIVLLIGLGFLFLGNFFGFITEAFVFFGFLNFLGFVLILVAHIILFTNKTTIDLHNRVQEEENKEEQKISYMPLFCGHCGTKVDKELIGCPGCGKNPQTSHNHCQTCGASLEKGQIMCIECHDSIRNQRLARIQKETPQNKNQRVDVDGQLLGAYLLPIIGIIYIIMNLSQRPKLAKILALYTGVSIGGYTLLFIGFFVDLLMFY